MKKLLLILSAVSCLSVGCSRSYVVRVNGFLAHGRSVRENAAVYVAADANLHNPIFEEEIIGKIEKLLAGH